MTDVIAMIQRDITLDVLATIAASNETLAYVFNRSEDPELRRMANSLMDTSDGVKRLFREKLTGWERDVYLQRAEGIYISPKATP